MVEKYKILEMLKKNDCFFSGESIAETMSVSRTAISDAVSELRSEGYNIESKTKRGYKYISENNILNKYEAQKLISGYEIIYFDKIDSTNNAAKKMMHDGKKENIIVIAENQTECRGRYGRSFFNAEKKGLYFSLSEIPRDDDTNLTIIPLVASLAVAESVADCTGLDIKIKWPNDILYGNKKLCGILTEASIEAESGKIKYYVVGIGINVLHNINDFPEDIAEIATSILIESGKILERKLLLHSVVKSFNKFISLKSTEIIEKYKKRLITDRKINFYKNGVKHEGFISGVCDNGNIKVKTESGELTLDSGEINFI